MKRSDTIFSVCLVFVNIYDDCNSNSCRNPLSFSFILTERERDASKSKAYNSFPFIFITELKGENLVYIKKAREDNLDPHLSSTTIVPSRLA